MKKHWLYFGIVACLIVGASVAAIIWVLHSGHTSSVTHNTPAQQTATTIPHNERQVVISYDQAMMKQDWTTLYTSAVTGTWGGYSEKEFSQLMAQQVKQKGTIVSITPLTNISNPEIKTNADLLTYFSVIEKVVMSKNGTIETATYGITFVLENGSWKFFTSKKI